MRGFIKGLIDKAKRSRVFRRNKKSLDTIRVIIFLWTFFEKDEPVYSICFNNFVTSKEFYNLR